MTIIVGANELTRREVDGSECVGRRVWEKKEKKVGCKVDGKVIGEVARTGSAGVLNFNINTGARWELASVLGAQRGECSSRSWYSRDRGINGRARTTFLDVVSVRSFLCI